MKMRYQQIINLFEARGPGGSRNASGVAGFLWVARLGGECSSAWESGIDEQRLVRWGDDERSLTPLDINEVNVERCCRRACREACECDEGDDPPGKHLWLPTTSRRLGQCNTVTRAHAPGRRT